MKTGEIFKQLERVLTIDGCGRPAKAKLLLKLVREAGFKSALRAYTKRQF